MHEEGMGTLYTSGFSIEEGMGTLYTSSFSIGLGMGTLRIPDSSPMKRGLGHRVPVASPLLVWDWDHVDFKELINMFYSTVTLVFRVAMSHNPIRVACHCGNTLFIYYVNLYFSSVPIIRIHQIEYIV